MLQPIKRVSTIETIRTHRAAPAVVLALAVAAAGALFLGALELVGRLDGGDEPAARTAGLRPVPDFMEPAPFGR